MFNKSNHKVEYFSKELETKKKNFKNENSRTEKKINLQYEPLPQGSLYTENNTGERAGNAGNFKPFHLFYQDSIIGYQSLTRITVKYYRLMSLIDIKQNSKPI